MDGPSTAAVLIIADYQYKSAFVADHAKSSACLTQLMMEVTLNESFLSCPPVYTLPRLGMIQKIANAMIQ